MVEILDVATYCARTEHPLRREAERLVHLAPRMLWPRQLPPRDVEDQERRAQMTRQREVTAMSIRHKLFQEGHWKLLFLSAEKAWKISRQTKDSKGGNDQEEEEAQRLKADFVVQKMVDSGISAATNMLLSEGVAPVTQHTIDMIKATLVTKPKEVPDRKRATKLRRAAMKPSDKATKKLLADADRGGAQDLFGWSYDVLQMFLQEKEAWKTLKAWIDVVAEVAFTEETGDLWAYSKGVALYKGSKEKVRALACGSTFRRVTLGALVKDNEEDLKSKAGNQQFALGLEGALENMAGCVKMADEEHPENDTIQLDAVSAFLLHFTGRTHAGCGRRHLANGSVDRRMADPDHEASPVRRGR